MRWMVFVAIWGSVQVQAAELACVEKYRTAYIEFSRTNSARYQDAADIYAVYFDYTHGFAVVQNEDHRRMLDVIKKGLEGGSFCTYFGATKSKNQILDLLLGEFKK